MPIPSVPSTRYRFRSRRPKHDLRRPASRGEGWSPACPYGWRGLLSRSEGIFEGRRSAEFRQAHLDSSGSRVSESTEPPRTLQDGQLCFMEVHGKGADQDPELLGPNLRQLAALLGGRHVALVDEERRCCQPPKGKGLPHPRTAQRRHAQLRPAGQSQTPLRSEAPASCRATSNCAIPQLPWGETEVA